jgi:hypothetical protein
MAIVQTQLHVQWAVVKHDFLRQRRSWKFWQLSVYITQDNVADLS